MDLHSCRKKHHSSVVFVHLPVLQPNQYWSADSPWGDHDALPGKTPGGDRVLFFLWAVGCNQKENWKSGLWKPKKNSLCKGMYFETSGIFTKSFLFGRFSMKKSSEKNLVRFIHSILARRNFHEKMSPPKSPKYFLWILKKKKKKIRFSSDFE